MYCGFVRQLLSNVVCSTWCISRYNKWLPEEVVDTQRFVTTASGRVGAWGVELYPNEGSVRPCRTAVTLLLFTTFNIVDPIITEYK